MSSLKETLDHNLGEHAPDRNVPAPRSLSITGAKRSPRSAIRAGRFPTPNVSNWTVRVPEFHPYRSEDDRRVAPAAAPPRRSPAVDEPTPGPADPGPLDDPPPTRPNDPIEEPPADPDEPGPVEEPPPGHDDPADIDDPMPRPEPPPVHVGAATAPA